MTTADYRNRLAELNRSNEAAALTYAAAVSVVSIALLLNAWGVF